MDGLDFPSADTTLQYKTSQVEHVPLHKIKWCLLQIDHNLQSPSHVLFHKN